jgi:hypothetical protein
MSLVVVAANVAGSSYIHGVSLPEMIGFAISDDGGGGDIYLNGQGVVNPTVVGAADAKTIFTSAGLLFRSIPLLRAFRLLYRTPNDAAAEEQFQNNLDISIYPIGGTDGATAGFPVVQANSSLPGAAVNIPYLHFQRPGGEGGVAGLWRVELRLRHTITN